MIYSSERVEKEKKHSSQCFACMGGPSAEGSKGELEDSPKLFVHGWKRFPWAGRFAVLIRGLLVSESDCEILA